MAGRFLPYPGPRYGDPLAPPPALSSSPYARAPRAPSPPRRRYDEDPLVHALLRRHGDPASSKKRRLDLSATEVSATRVNASLDQPAAQVAFIFAQPWSRPPQVLWASKPILVAASPYFAAMLDSGMSEAALVPANEPLDDGLARDPSPVLAPDDPRVVGLGAAAHRVVVKDTSAPVYRAVLLWIMTGVVDFDSTGAADDQLPPARAEDVYILADKLELPPLKALALPVFLAELQDGNLIDRAFGRMAAFPAVESVLLDRLVASWDKLRASPALLQVEQEYDAGSRPNYLTVTRKLIKRLHG